MKNDTPESPDDLLAKLLASHGPSSAEIDPHTRKLREDPDAQAAFDELRALQEAPPPEAPEAVQIAGEGGALIIQAEAAATYVPVIEVMPEEGPRLPSGPVRIKKEIDPRRATTERVPVRAVSTSVVDEAPVSASEPPSVDALREEPASTAKIATPGSTRRIGLVVLAITFVAGMIVTMALVKRPEAAKEATASATATQAAPAVVSGAAPAVVSSAPASVSAPQVEATAPSASVSAAPSVPASAATTGVRSAPPAPPKHTARPAPSSAPSAAPSSVPAAAPTTTSTSTPNSDIW